MKKAIEAILWHFTAFKDKNCDYHHQFYPAGEQNWYTYQNDKLTGKPTHKNKIDIPEWTFNIMKPIFEFLSSDHLLMRRFKSIK